MVGLLPTVLEWLVICSAGLHTSDSCSHGLLWVIWMWGRTFTYQVVPDPMAGGVVQS